MQRYAPWLSFYFFLNLTACLFADQACDDYSQNYPQSYPQNQYEQNFYSSAGQENNYQEDFQQEDQQDCCDVYGDVQEEASCESCCSGYSLKLGWWSCCPYPYRLYAGYRTGNGFGYSGDYSTIGFFAAPPMFSTSSFVPFVDFRGHFFNNGGSAANVGGGARFILDNCGFPIILGINGYFDYLDDHCCSYQQVGIGLEQFNPCFDLRINAYIPVGKQNCIYDRNRIDCFYGSYYFECSKRSNQYGGFDAEIGTWLRRSCCCNECCNSCCSSCWGIYLAAGPYYYVEDFSNRCKDCSKKHAFGGRARLVACVCPWLQINVDGIYDSVTRGAVSAQIVLTLPFGRQPRSCCKNDAYLWDIASQPVYRQEIIPTKHHRVWKWNWSTCSGMSHRHRSF